MKYETESRAQSNGTDSRISTSESFDVVIVGGGPAGSAVGVFTARYGLDTLIFDRGNSSLQRCAFLENYLGFPGGIDIETFYELIHDHATEMGCKLRSEFVEEVDQLDSGRFKITTQDDDIVEADRVVAATRYKSEYLRELNDEGEMFETRDRGGKQRNNFDCKYPDEDGRTPTDGLYVASPAEDVEIQVLSSAGHGSRVARTVIEDVRREHGFPDGISDYNDWMRRLGHGRDKESMRDKLRGKINRDLPDDVDEESLVEIRDSEVDRRLDRYLSQDKIEHRTERGHDRLLEHIDDDRILAAAHEIKSERRTDSDRQGETSERDETTGDHASNI
ncbi:NAD(P)/FAD-dependent oxidoreductase [Halorubrum trapanicum]